MAQPIHCGNKVTRLIISAMAIVAATSYFNIMPLRADSRLMSCPILAEKFGIGAINFDPQKNAFQILDQ